MLAREWCDTVSATYEYFVIEAEELKRPEFLDVFMSGIQKKVSISHQIVNNPEQCHSSQVELSQKIITYLSEMVFPQPLQEVLGKYLDLHNG
jgi:hypothetical protein